MRVDQISISKISRHFYTKSFLVSGLATFSNITGKACEGRYNKTRPYIASIGPQYFVGNNSKSMCDRRVLVRDPTYGFGVIVRIVDVCRKCTNTDIVLSKAAFQRMRSVLVGFFTADWEFL